MHDHHWKLDDALGLVGHSTDVDGLEHVVTPEQTVDTVLLRNLDAIPNALLGSPGRFLFHSAIYWGAFDVCCILADRRLVAFENKGRPLTKRDFEKFCRDAGRIKTDGYDYVHKRYQHVLNDLPYYMKCAERMFAAAFLGIRCDVEKDARNLTDEACAALSIDKDLFLDRFHRRNGWLASLDASLDLSDHLAEFAGAADWREFTPVLLVPAADLVKVQQWSQEQECPSGITAQLATYKFGIERQRGPVSFSLRRIGQFSV